MERGVREKYLDVMKLIGSFAIVALHTISNTLNAAGYVPAPQAITMNILHQLFYTAVPVFLMITGSGFLATGRDNSYAKMWRHICKLIACILIFGLLFGGVKQLDAGESIQIKNLVAAILGDSTWSHMWYLYSLLGIYLCMPMMSAFASHGRMKDQVIFAGVLLIVSCIYPNVAGMLGIYTVNILPVNGMWFFYVVTGGIIGRVPIEILRKFRIPAFFGVFAGMLSIIGVCIWQGIGYIFAETHPLTALLAVSLFLATRILCDEKVSCPWQEKMAGNALGVYVIHPVFIHICVRLLRFNPQGYIPVLTLPLTILTIFGLSMAVVSMARRIPLIRKYLF